MFGAFQDIVVVIPVEKTPSSYRLITRVAGHRITDSNTPPSTHVMSRQSGYDRHAKIAWLISPGGGSNMATYDTAAAGGEEEATRYVHAIVRHSKDGATAMHRL